MIILKNDNFKKQLMITFSTLKKKYASI